MDSKPDEVDYDRTMIAEPPRPPAPRGAPARPSLRQLHTQVHAIPTRLTGRLQQLDQPKTVYILGDRRYTLGRDANCDLVLAAKGASRVHAVVYFDGGHFLIEDQGSRNGIFINGVAQTRIALNNGDVIRICEHEIRFDSALASAGAAPEEATRIVPAPMPTMQRSEPVVPLAAPAAAAMPAPANIPTVAPFQQAPNATLDDKSARRRTGASISSLFGLALSLVVVGVLSVLLAFALGRASVGAAEPDRLAFPGDVQRGGTIRVTAPVGGVVVDIAAVDAPVRRGATIAQLRVPVTPADRERWERNLELARAAGESATVSALEARLNVPDRTIGVLATADGQLVRAFAVAGANVAAGSVIAEIALEDAMRIEVDVTALAASRVVAGSRARVRWTGGADDVSVDTVFAADGARVAVILLPQAKPEHFSERPVVEFP